MDMRSAFFRYARERHAIYLRREAGEPWPWTKDPVLQVGRFTNVFRELDRTTKWFREHVREPMRDDPRVLMATVIFRWFNRTTTGEALFCQTCLPPGPGEPGASAFVEYLSELEAGRTDPAPLKVSIRQYLSAAGPFITGAYTINTRSAGLGLSKLDGVLRLIEMWVERHVDWLDFAQDWIDGNYQSMEEFCAWAASPCLAGFMTYELACDLRWTALLERAHDVDEWANVGPGAVRGLNRIHGRPAGKGMPQETALLEMRKLLAASRQKRLWPEAWQRWELREVEHTLCEFDKYERCRLGQGRTRGSYRPPVGVK